MTVDQITTEQSQALSRFKSKQGRQWKSRLIALWVTGRDDRGEDGALLRQVRNSLGLDGLARLKI
jgi:hypothetical protein